MSPIHGSERDWTDSPRIRSPRTLCELPVFYATTEGQTRRVAETLATTLRSKGFESCAVDLTSRDADSIDWSDVRGVVVGGSIHAGRHQRQVESFVKRNAAELNQRPSAFFSVSLSAGSANVSETEAARQLAEALPRKLGWHPDTVVCFAGRLAYTRYGFLKRLIMKSIARRHGAPTDVSRDYEFTNWDAVRGLAEHVAALVKTQRLHARMTLAQR